MIVEITMLSVIFVSSLKIWCLGLLQWCHHVGQRSNRNSNKDVTHSIWHNKGRLPSTPGHGSLFLMEGQFLIPVVWCGLKKDWPVWYSFMFSNQSSWKLYINYTDRRNIGIADEILDLVVNKYKQYIDLQYSVLFAVFSHKRVHFHIGTTWPSRKIFTR